MDPETESLLSRACDLERQLSEVRLALAGMPRERWDGRAVSVLVCRSDATRFAVPVAQVDEVVPTAAWSELPGAEPWVRGALEVAGELVPVLDVGARLGAPPCAPSLDGALVLCRSRARPVALCASEVPALLHVEAPSVLPAPAELREAPFVAACLSLDADSIPLLSVFTLALASGRLLETT